MEPHGILPDCSRRDFIKVCVTVSAMLGLPLGMVSRVMAAAQSGDLRPSVIWLHFQECTGCSESLLRSSHPTVSKLILELISLDYHEILMAGAGHQAEQAQREALRTNRDNYLLVVEGAIPTKDDGIYCKIAGKTAMDSLATLATGAMAIVAIGSCASFGGIQAVDPNPTGAVGVQALVKDKPLVNIAGCPPNPYNFLSTVLYYLTFNKLPEQDALGRPKFAYGRRIHEHCERRAHFDAGRFATAFGDESHSLGYCLYKLGCKGPATYANCSVVRFNDAGVWPVSTGHPCIGCTEPALLFRTAIADKLQIHEPTPFDSYAPIDVKDKGKGPDPLTTGFLGLGAGAAIGAAAMIARQLPDRPEPGEPRKLDQEPGVAVTSASRPPNQPEPAEHQNPDQGSGE